MPASNEEIERALEEGVKLITGRGLKKVVYDGDKVIGLETKKCVSVFDEKGRFSPVYDEDDVEMIASDSIILATGQRVDLDFLGEKFKEEIQSARGLIEVGEHQNTRKPGVYAGGDAATGPSVAIKAIRSGAAAAKSMSKYMGYPISTAVEEKKLLTNDAELIHVTKGIVETDTPVGKRCLDLEDSATITKEEAVEEAGRCMNCGCYSVNASDLTPVLIALHAVIKTTHREIAAEELFATSLKVQDMLEKGEIVTEIKIPVADGEMHYDKFRLRDSIDFAMVSLASLYQVENGKITNASVVLGGVAPVPMRREAVEAYLIGKEPTEETAKEAAKIALEGAVPFEKNRYKLNIIESLVKQSVLRVR